MHIGTMTINDKDHLVIGGCDLVDLAAQHGTPVYIFDEEEFIARARAYFESLGSLPDYEVVYAGKALLTKGIARLAANVGLSLDVVSGGELYTALAGGFPPERIYFHGNNKSADELQAAVAANVGRIVVDNLFELDILAAVAEQAGRDVPILLRLTPGVEAHTHSYIQTGQLDSKFGIPMAYGQALAAVKKAAGIPSIDLRGIHCHIGSQILDPSSFAIALDIMTDFLATAKSEGIALPELDIGGGLGIRHTDAEEPVPINEFGQLLAAELTSCCDKKGLALPKLLVEPGRSLVGEAGTTLYTVGSIKEIPGIRTFAAVDGGMGDNPRVALYQAQYHAIVANKARAAAEKVYAIAGKCCESGDMLIDAIKLPTLAPGDLLAVPSTGAYNFSMASNYNLIPRLPIINVYQGQSDILVRRESYADLTRLQAVPDRWSAAVMV